MIKQEDKSIKTTQIKISIIAILKANLKLKNIKNRLITLLNLIILEAVL
ncbi:hypothetical protein [Campylobacter iguaniorum]|nr:hypothetical protein [Campylobacter iguaniorum]